MPALRSPRVRSRLFNPAAPPPEQPVVLVYAPTTAAARPATPGGKGLHRATDTEAVTYFDGTSWRPVTVRGTGLVEVAGGDFVSPARAASTVLDEVLGGMMAAAPLGAVLIHDGAGGLALCANDLAALFAANDTAGARTALVVYSKAEVDNALALLAGGLSAKPNIQAATVGPIANLAAVTLASVFSGYVPVANDRVMVKDNASPNGIAAVSNVHNGWYLVGAVTAGVAALTRIADANASAEFVGVTTCLIARGSLAGRQYKTAQGSGFTLGTDAITFTEIPATPLGTDTPQPLGVPSPGASGAAADQAHVHAMPTAAQVGAVPASGGTMSGALAMGGSKVTGLGAPSAAGDALAAPASVADGDELLWSGGTLARLPIGSPGQRRRVAAAGTASEWADPDLVCTTAELATTYAPSAVLRGVVAYANDSGATYVCRRTAVSTYAWLQLGSGAAHGSGTLASRPASPAAGDSYVVTSGVATGDRYECFVAGAWALVSYLRESADDTPAMLWSLTETTGTYASQGTYSVPLTVNGSPDRTALAYNGQTCLWCNGTSTQYAAGVAGTMGISTAPTALTLAAWARVRSTSPSIRVLLMAQYASTFANPYGVQLALNGSSIRALIVKAGAYQDLSGGTVSVSEQWQLIGWTYDGTTIRYYLNGELAGTSTPSGGAALDLGSGSRWVIGGTPGGSEAWIGGLASVRVYTTAQPLSWWRALYARGVGSYAGA